MMSWRWTTCGVLRLRLAPDDPRLQRGALPAMFLLEALAQATAAYNGALARGGSGAGGGAMARGEAAAGDGATGAGGSAAGGGDNAAAGAVLADGAPREIGMLVSIDRAHLHGCPRGGDDVHLTVRPVHQLGPVVRFATRASVGEALLADAEVTVRRGLGPGSDPERTDG